LVYGRYTGSLSSGSLSGDVNGTLNQVGTNVLDAGKAGAQAATINYVLGKTVVPKLSSKLGHKGAEAITATGETIAHNLLHGGHVGHDSHDTHDSHGEGQSGQANPNHKGSVVVDGDHHGEEKSEAH
jgi:hypothetical protein